jgi:hypothetical protein
VPGLMAVGGKNGAHGLSPLPCYRIGSWRRSVGGGLGQFRSQSLQRPVVSGHHVRNITALNLGDRGLGNACALRDLRLGQAMRPDGCDVVFSFHVNIPLRLF